MALLEGSKSYRVPGDEQCNEGAAARSRHEL